MNKYSQKSKPFSKLKKEIEKLFLPALDLQLFYNSYRIGSHGNRFPRIYFQMKKEIIWDFPKDFKNAKLDMYIVGLEMRFSDIVREYIQFDSLRILDFAEPEVSLDDSVPFKDSKSILQIAQKEFIQILQVSDKRIALSKLKEFYINTNLLAVKLIINQRMNV